MTDLTVSAHAVLRYRQRVRNVDDEEAERALTTRAFHCAAHLGRCSVILPSGHRAIVQDHTVVTVLPLGGYAFHGQYFEKGSK